MEKTFAFRKSCFKKHRPTPEEIFDIYPKFLDFNGEIVNIRKCCHFKY